MWKSKNIIMKNDIVIPTEKSNVKTHLNIAKNEAKKMKQDKGDIFKKH